jgi:hypothetical protein
MSIKTRRITAPGSSGKKARGSVVIAGTAEDQALTCLRKALLQECPDEACSVMEDGWSIEDLDYTEGLGYAKGSATIWSIPSGSNRMKPKRQVAFELKWKDGADGSNLPSPELIEYSIS